MQKDRVLRGGSWDNFSDLCRSAFRGRSQPVNWDNYFGFRVVVRRKRDAKV